MMLEHLGEVEAANAIVDAIERVLSGSDLRTRDMGGRASTEELGHTIAGLI
jgi:tartrate dehydrogenase/decarboxylase/D-malate dehydrogenase